MPALGLHATYQTEAMRRGGLNIDGIITALKSWESREYAIFGRRPNDVNKGKFAGTPYGTIKEKDVKVVQVGVNEGLKCYGCRETGHLKKCIFWEKNGNCKY